MYDTCRELAEQNFCTANTADLTDEQSAISTEHAQATLTPAAAVHELVQGLP